MTALPANRMDMRFRIGMSVNAREQDHQGRPDKATGLEHASREEKTVHEIANTFEW